MTSFDINKIISTYKINIDALASILFPGIKYPKLALNRVLNGTADLSVTQLEKLADYIGVKPSDLFLTGTWKDASENGCLSFKKGPFLAKVNYNGAFTTLYKNGEVIEQIISGSDMKVKDYIDFLDNLISKY